MTRNGHDFTCLVNFFKLLPYLEIVFQQPVAGAMSASDVTGMSEGDDLPEDLPFPLHFKDVFDVVTKKGTWWLVECKICGWGPRKTTLTRLIYGHLLGQPKQHIQSCVAKSILERDYPDLYAELLCREQAHQKKRL